MVSPSTTAEASQFQIKRGGSGTTTMTLVTEGG
jgi:hypothetical protein